MTGKYILTLALTACAFGSLSPAAMAQGAGPKGPPRRGGGMTAPDDADQRAALMRAVNEAIQKKYHLTARGVGLRSDCRALPKTTRDVAYNIEYVVPYKYVPQSSPLRGGKKWDAIHVNLKRGKDDKWTVADWTPAPDTK